MFSGGNGLSSSPHARSASTSPAVGVAQRQSLRSVTSSVSPEKKAAAAAESPSSSPARAARLQRLLSEKEIDLDKLRKLCWTGIAPEYRAHAWLVMLHVLPVAPDQWPAMVQKRLNSYRELVQGNYNLDESQQTAQMHNTLKQIQKDAPRTHPDLPVFQHPRIQELLVRLLYIWAVRHPATGYVQGMNDLVSPFIYVFLADHCKGIFEDINLDSIDDAALELVESRSFFCFSKISDLIPDNYLFGQPGIQRMLYRFEQLVKRIEAPLYNHLIETDVQFLQFGFRWMNCYLIREMPLDMIVRLWDTYISDDQNAGFTAFHVYATTSLLVYYGPQLMGLNFPDILMFLQNLPTRSLTPQDVDSILSQAFVYQSLFSSTKF
ncbi:Rab-GAP TBC domain-containing protein [Plasmodiophora brassicae]|uniref:Rab-GAP TBC domain-containing protein n=1 Tax=Plasmodiophora brassicae TaxID=37360 RepID=A0A0G4IIS7_PLABS|nr:hypothetical protein PBRA_003844 [Plasmodiophora brassicae]SPQ94360.1 unnamed protein product [Plasmodiophora brassicae]